MSNIKTIPKNITNNDYIYSLTKMLIIKPINNKIITNNEIKSHFNNY